MAKYRKLGMKSDQRRALLKNQVTNLLYHGRIETTVTRAKEVKKLAEKLITIAVKEAGNFEEKTVMAKVAKKDELGKRVKEVKNGKRVTVFEEVERTVKIDSPSRLHARRQMLKMLVPVTEVTETRKKRANTSRVSMVDKMFDEVAPKYVDRKGGYTRILKVGPRRGDGAEMAIIELV
ncbi:MAG: 50S ribosomal protein L17 [Clostridia bacterium]|jgi:large subunit ribosomal protein L17|nr:50S ribosomal protein L17 [Clostridia bacterium]